MSAVPLCKDDPALGGYVTFRRASAVLGETRYTIWKMVARGELASEMIAGRPLITVESVNNVLISRASEKAAASATA